MGEHTPGPWRVAEGRSCWHVVSGDNALHTGCITFDGRGLANANLIAAAPDLLAALKDMEHTAMRLGLSRGEDGDGPWADALLAHFAAIERARAAIAKAEGQ